MSSHGSQNCLQILTVSWDILDYRITFWVPLNHRRNPREINAPEGPPDFGTDKESAVI